MRELAVLSGAGNRFAVFDGFAGPPPEDVSALARALCGPGAGTPGAGGAPLDGLLLMLPPRAGGDLRMEVVNADGSRAETCGNGLRCVAKLAFERGHVRSSGFVVEDGAGPHRTVVVTEDQKVVAARVDMGSPRIVAREERLEIDLGGRPSALVGARVDVGNPHFVILVADERTADVGRVGAALARHASFPRGTNVEFLAARDGELRLRVWERGVGETKACGSGACAAAVIAAERGLARWPIALRLPGGVLRVHRGDAGHVELEGPVEELGSIELPARATSA